jgi:hypothetical protein
VINAGVPGSDPVFAWELLRRKMVKYQPDLVLDVVNTSDIADLVNRGGEERFTPDGWIRPPRKNWLGKMAKHSHLLRAFLVGILGYSYDFLPMGEEKKREERSYAIIADMAEKMGALGRKKGFKFLMVVLPAYQEPKASRDDFFEITYSGLIFKALQEKKLPVAELYTEIHSRLGDLPLQEFMWPRDAHYNKRGYEIVGNALYAELSKQGYL